MSAYFRHYDFHTVVYTFPASDLQSATAYYLPYYNSNWGEMATMPQEAQ